MGHAVPERQPGAAPITLARYTHALPQDIARARHQLSAYLVRASTPLATGAHHDADRSGEDPARERLWEPG